jgi:DNA-binding LytR/AlgR family response regulator
MNCIIVDDEPLARQGIEALLKADTSLNLKGCFNNAASALEFLSLNNVELMFLDIQLQGMSGLELANAAGPHTLVIFITAYPGYAVESYAVDALDYLVKPVNKESFYRSVQKAKDYLQLLKDSKKPATEGWDLQTGYVFLKEGRLFHKVFINDIAYIEGLKDYVVVYHKAQKIMAGVNVRNIQAQLPASMFVRVSKSYLVNLRHITSVTTYSVFIHEVEIPIGDSYRKAFFEDFVKGRLVER